MKICPTCGTQLDDYVAFCPTCGATLAAPAAPAAPTYAAPVAPAAPTYAAPAPVSYAAPAAAPAPAKPFVPVMTFISKLLTILCAMFTACGLAASYIRVSVSRYSSSVYAYFRPEEGCSVLALLTAIAALVFAIIGFILVLVKKGGAEKVLAAIAQMVAATAAMVVGIVMVSNM